MRTLEDNGFEPKGLPPFDDLGYSSRNDSVCYITKDGEGDNETTLERALGWVRGDASKLHYRGDEPQWVDHPDWHSHNWLTTAEYEQAINNYIEYGWEETDKGIKLAFNKDLESKIFVMFLEDDEE